MVYTHQISQPNQLKIPSTEDLFTYALQEEESKLQYPEAPMFLDYVRNRKLVSFKKLDNPKARSCLHHVNSLGVPTEQSSYWNSHLLTRVH